MVTSFRELLLARLENYGKYSSFTKKYITPKPFNGKGLKIKVYDDGIKIKVRTDIFILINDNLEVYLQDTIYKGMRFPKMLVRKFRSMERLLTYLDTIFVKPSLLIKELSSKSDPLVVGKFKFGNRLLRDHDDNIVNALRQSQLEEIVSESIEVGGSNFSFNIGATIDTSLQPKIRSKRRG